MKTYKKPQNRSDLLVKKCSKEIWQERKNAQDRNKDLKVQKVQGAVLKGAFGICEVTNALINLKNKKDISGKELRLQLSNVIKICTKSLTFLGMANLEWGNIRRQYLSKMLPPKLSPLTKDVPTPSEFLLGNNLNDRIGIVETSQKYWRPIPILLTIKIQKIAKISKNPGNQNKGYSSSSQTRGYKQQQQPNQRLQQPLKTTAGVSTITIPQEKLSCIKVGTTSIVKFQQKIIPILNRDIQNFRGGNLKNHLTNWENVTSDKIIPDIIEDRLKLDLIDTPKSSSKFAFPLSHEEKLIVKKEVALLKGKNIVAKANVTENNTFVSGVFTRSKKDGSERMILNLKRLNKFVEYKHFKMESLQIVLELIRPGVYMASIDLKDAFYSVPVHKNQQAY